MYEEVKELGKKSMQSFIGQAAGQLLSAAWVILIGRLLGAGIYGDYLYVYTVLSFFTIFSKLGLESAIIYYIARSDIEDELKGKIITFALLTVGIVGLTCVFVCEIGNIWIADVVLGDKTLNKLVIGMAPLIVLEAEADVFYGILRGKRKIFQVTLAQNMITFAARVAGLLFMAGIFGIRNVMCIILPQYVGGIFSVFYSIKVAKESVGREVTLNARDYGRLKRGQQIRILQYSIPLVLMNAVMLINHNADKYMLGYMKETSEVAIYTVAVYIGSFSTFVLTAINSIFAPMISDLYASQKIVELDMLYKKATRWTIIINLAIFSMTINFPSEIMRLSGDEFARDGKVLIVVMLGQIINAGVGSVGYLNSMTGHTKINLFSSVIAVAVNLILNFVLILPFGMLGAAVASAVSVALNNLLNLWYVHKNIGIFPYVKRDIWVVLTFAVSTLMTRFVFHYVNCFFMIRLIAGGMLFVTLYFTMIYIVGLDIDEKFQIKEMLKKWRGII